MGKPIPYIQIVGSRLASTVLGTKDSNRESARNRQTTETIDMDNKEATVG